MRLPLLTALIVLVVNAAVDFYVYAAAHSYSKHRWLHAFVGWSALLFAIAFIVAEVFVEVRICVVAAMWMLFAYFSVYVIKYSFLIFDVISRLPALWRRKRWKSMSTFGVLLGSVLCAMMWYGALVGRYHIHITRVDANVPGLSESLDGTTIAQISDLHLGTFGTDTAFVSKLVNEVNALHPDVIVFTGDLVNQKSSEMEPFAVILSRLSAPMGVYTIMGNHDYSYYSKFDSDSDRRKDAQHLRERQQCIGWEMLSDRSVALGDSLGQIELIGVEYIGDAPFSSQGCLEAAYPDLNDSNPKILLTHNPNHWIEAIKDNPKTNVALTLSGHTHAMQIELFGISPAAFKYKAWGGMYRDSKGQQLYVNIGAGEVGMPCRIGATPEITLITLKKQ